MSDDILNTIEVLAKKVTTKEEEANKLKRLVNELCDEAGIAPRYVNIADPSLALASIRSDQFYGQTLTAAIRNYLEQRKSAQLGAATVLEIYTAIRDGGYKFGSKNEDNAKIVVSSALRKSSSIFHRLPNGQYGLLAWYPTAKAKPENGQETKKESKGQPEKSSEDIAEQKNAITNSEIREVILAQTGQFKAADIEDAVKAKFPSKTLTKDKIPTVVFLLKKKGLLNVISVKAGSRPAVYSKA
jgi:hypothetical protein